VRFRWLVLLTALVSSPVAAAAPTVTETPYPGVVYARYDLASPSARVHVVAIDLSSSELDLVATAESDKGKTVAELAAVTGTHIVVNANSFEPDGYQPVGLARGNGATWSLTADDPRHAVASFYRGPSRTQLDLSPPEQVIGELEAKVVGAVSGRPMVVRAGAAMTAPDCTDLVALPCLAAPRTALAHSADGNTLWLVVVDGWQTGSPGLTAVQLGGFLAELGADAAIMLDGGSASSLFIAAKGGLVSSPSDGVARPVANHLAVRFGAQPPGFLRGVVRERNLEGSQISATVTLDDGRAVNYNGTGEWSFEVAPRFACVTASATGYQPNTTCRQITSQQTTYGSVFLFPSSEVIDAGPDDDATTSPDAGPSGPDAGPPPDAGPTNALDGQGGCSAAGPTGGLSLLVVLALSARRRRRKD
jgi:uncharacterized protein (TIGR03382 family)